MTNNEAISRIKFLLDVGGSDGFTSSDKEALNTAINALSECKKPKTNGDRIRTMTDEELAEYIARLSRKIIEQALYNGKNKCKECCVPKYGSINREVLFLMLKMKVSEDAGIDD